LDLVEKVQLSRGTEFFFDNLFTSFPLLEKLSEKVIGGTGTVRQNRLHKTLILSKKDMEKKLLVRGHMDLVYKNDQVQGQGCVLCLQQAPRRHQSQLQAI